MELAESVESGEPAARTERVEPAESAESVEPAARTKRAERAEAEEPQEAAARESVSGTLDVPAEREPEPERDPLARAETLPKVDLGTDEPEPDVHEPDEPEAAEQEQAEKPVRHRAQRPAGKRRATGTTRPADLTAAEAETKSGTRSRPAAIRVPAQSRGPRNPYAVAAILAVVAVILAGLAVWFRGEASALESRDSNTALTDPATTSEVLGQLSTAVETTLSYNYTDLESTQKAVETALADTARCEYDKLFGQLMELAPKQKLILATTVRDISLVRLDGDRAEALVFVDFVSTRVDTNKSWPDGAVFGVLARRDGDQWKITEFNMFDQALASGEPVPQC